MSRYFWNFKPAWYTEVCAHPIRPSKLFPHSHLVKALIMANAQLPSPKKSQSAAGHSRAKAESDLDSQFGCPMCGLIGLTPSFLRAVHMPSCSTDYSKSVDKSPCPHIQMWQHLMLLLIVREINISRTTMGFAPSVNASCVSNCSLALAPVNIVTVTCFPITVCLLALCFPSKGSDCGTNSFAWHIEPFVCKGHQKSKVMPSFCLPHHVIFLLKNLH